tara:strand:- start:11745 stop:12362 length:618 start_codon:yes stop_codon:yes gene_type:complete
MNKNNISEFEHDCIWFSPEGTVFYNLDKKEKTDPENYYSSYILSKLLSRENKGLTHNIGIDKNCTTEDKQKVANKTKKETLIFSSENIGFVWVCKKSKTDEKKDVKYMDVTETLIAVRASNWVLKIPYEKWTTIIGGKKQPEQFGRFEIDTIINIIRYINDHSSNDKECIYWDKFDKSDQEHFCYRKHKYISVRLYDPLSLYIDY